MKEKWTYNFLRKFIIVFLTVAMIVSGACMLDVDGSTVLATETTTESTTETMSTEPIYVPVDNIEEYRSESGYTFPKPTGDEAVGKEDWVFAGWYYEDTDSDAGYTAYRESEMNNVSSAYAKYVSPDVLSAKFQVTAGTNEASEKASLRVVSTIDSTNYKKVGFRLTSERTGVTQTKESSTVYKRILSATEGLDYGYSPVIFDTEAEYFMTITIANIKNANFDYSYIATPYWITLDGTTVNGVTRSAKVSDSYNGIANIPVRLYTDATVGAGTITVTYDSTAFTYKESEEFTFNETKEDILSTGATVTDGSAVDGIGTVTVTLPEGTSLEKPDGMLVNLRFTVLDAAESNEKFEITGVSGVSDTYYRTFSSYYTGTPDTSWYDEFKEQDKFVLATAEDLYGFAQIVNASSGDYKSEQFAEDTVLLGADITINKGQATTDGWDTSKDADGNAITDGTGTDNKWVPIGYTPSYRFQGTFNGCGNTIEGIYCVDDYENRTSADENYTGLFGITLAGSTVRNFSLTNSYFESSVGFSNYAMMGSVVGQLAGDVDSVYSDAIVNSAYMHVGGLVGRVNPGSSTGTCTITNSWFDGSVTVTEATCKNNGVGGILGKLVQGKAEITDCLNTANITYTATAMSNTSATSHNVGIGGIHGHGGATMTNCINVGTAKATLPTGVKVLGINYAGSRTNCIESTSVADYNGYKGYIAAKDKEFGFYDWATDIGNWVCRATADDASNGIPVLKSFCDEWIDVSWYYDDTDATEFTISHAEELYGWSEIDNVAEVQFAEDVVVKLGDDIKLNNGVASVWATTENTAITDSLRKYMPIGNTSKPFAATFDGQMHTISGVYLNTDTSGAGLFGEIASTGAVRNLYIKESLFKITTTGADSSKLHKVNKDTAADIGSVAGVNHGTISTVYSDAIIVSDARCSGGIVGWMKTDSASVDNCWFDGEITLTGSGGRLSGGIVGYLAANANQTFSVTDCLYTGDLTFDATSTWGLRIGGIVGGAWDLYTPTINLENCVSAGTITQNNGATTNTTAVASVYGGFDEDRATTLNLVNVYGTKECFASDGIYHVKDDVVVSNLTVNGTGTLMAESDLHGVAGYQNTLLNFEKSWAARSGEVPGLKPFVKNSLSIANAIRPDTSWYNEGETRQEILDEADMYGFMKLMAEGNTFAGKEVYLMADLTKMNAMGTDTLDKWKAGTEVPDNEWVAGTQFAGIFDGQMHTISGVYLNTDTPRAGLFGEISSGGSVSNLYITHSLFKYTKSSDTSKQHLVNKVAFADIGSVAGVCNGTVDTVYSDAIIVTDTATSGGIVGYMQTSGANVNNCWFNGNMDLTTADALNSGGIVGYMASVKGDKFSITNCLYTGKLSFTTTSISAWGRRIGGIVGGAWDHYTPTISIENCLSAGSMKCKTNGATGMNGISSVYGGLDNSGLTLNLVNVYGTNECYEADKQIYDYYGDGTANIINGTGLMKAEVDLKGTNGYQNTLLDFEETWVAREGDVPALKAFTDVIGTIADLTGVEQNNWYDENETIFGISSAPALNGFSTLSATNDFTGKTVLLLDDIEVNSVKEGTLAAWKAGAGTLPSSWTPIGATKAFAGTFDGQMYTISGVYLNTATAKAGLFGEIATGGNVSNLYIKDSCFKTTNTDIGSVAGISYGTVDTVFSNAIIVSEKSRSGGIVGHIPKTDTNKTAYIDNCWFDGQMELASGATQSGGMVGYISNSGTATVSVTNCLYTGSIQFKATSTKWGIRIGGIVGGARDYYAPTITLENCISAGTIKQASGSTNVPAVSAVYGGFDEPRATVLTLTNVYGTNECFATARIYHQYFADSTATGNPPTVNGTGTLIAEEDLYGTWGYQNTLLDFDNTWAARSNDVPALKAFADASLSVADTIRPDTSWYVADNAEQEIYDAADMYGFMKLLAEGNTFEGKTIKVMNNLVMNPTEENTVSKWQAGTEVPKNKWVSSFTGKTTNFAGTFDGNECTISGIYCVGAYEYLGLFGTTLTGSTVKKFKLTDSYFKQTGTGNTGSIASEVQGTIDSVYTDAIVEGTATHIGGIAALTSGLKYAISTGDPTTTSTSTDENGYTVIEQTVEVVEGRHIVNIKNCWFDGEVNATSTEEWARIGGIVASPTQGRLDMDNCLFTGTIYTQAESGNTRVGGFVGTRSSSSPTSAKTTTTTDDEAKTITKVTTNTTIIYEDTGEQANTTLYVDSSIAAGQIINRGVAEIGSAVGYVSHGKFTNVFVTRDTYPVTHRVGDTFKNQPIQTYNTDRIIGYCVDPTDGFTLNFTEDWSMRVSGVPIPKTLEGVVGVENIVDVSTLTAEIGLDTWSKTLAEAVDYGMGNYVVSAVATHETYTAYLSKLDNELDFDPYTDNSESDMDDDGVYNAIYTKDSGDWVLNITFVEKEGKIYISISTVGEEGLADNLQATEANITLANATNETTKEVSFSMLELVGAYGNGFVFKLPNGHFMINDGGKITESDQLLSYLQELAGSDKVVIDAWVITHTHEDHCGVAQTIFGNSAWTNSVQLNAIYVTEANDATKLLEGASAKVIEDTNLSFRGLLSLTQEDGVSKPAIHRMHMGERYYFSGMTMDVVQAHEQIPYTDHNKYGDIDSFNYTSTNCVYTLTNTGKKILIGGDSNNVNMQYMMMAYGKNNNYTEYNQNDDNARGGASKTLANINIFVAYHHGKNAISTFNSGYNPYPYNISGTATNEWADYLLKNPNNVDGANHKFDAVLFPYKEIFDMKKYDSFTASNGQSYDYIWGGDDGSIVYPYNMSDINQYYIDNSKDGTYYTYGYEDYVDGEKTTAETRHGTVQFIYKEDKSVETVIHETKISN